MVAAAKVPLSEDPKKFKDWGPDECIAELKRIAEAEPERVITRNYFRNTSRCSESTWNQHFGTFGEFKSAAGVTLSRPAKKLEQQIARHASLDRIRATGLERLNYGDNYRRPNRRRFKTACIITDVHDINCDPFTWRVFVDTVRRIQPDKTLFGGDMFDMPEFSKYTVDPRTWGPVARIKNVHRRFRDVREAAPETEMDLVEGNHERRLLTHLAEATPALKTVLSELHGFTIPKLLGLDEYEVNYHAAGDLAVFNANDAARELKKNYLILWDSVLVHHFPTGRQMGIPGCHGHHHKHIVWPHFSQRYGSSEWHQLGCGHARAAEYCDGQPWSNGFLIVHVDTHTLRTNFEYVEVRDIAVVGGKYYQRRESEAA